MSFRPTGLSSAAKRIRRILDPAYPLCREDVIWVLHFVQKSGSEGSCTAGSFKATFAAKFQQLLRSRAALARKRKPHPYKEPRHPHLSLRSHARTS